MTSSYKYRKIWIENNGPIPLDEDGRTYEIHHKDGDRKNNSIDNLECISIKEHYDRHYKKGDWGACVMIAKRMNLPPDYRSNIQKGKKRPGIGGRKQGSIPWNKGIKGYRLNISEQGIINRKQIGKESAIIQDVDAIRLREEFSNQSITINDPKIGKIQKNGRMYTYKTAFCKYYGEKFEVKPQYIRAIIDKRVKVDV